MKLSTKLVNEPLNNRFFWARRISDERSNQYLLLKKFVKVFSIKMYRSASLYPLHDFISKSLMFSFLSITGNFLFSFPLHAHNSFNYRLLTRCSQQLISGRTFLFTHNIDIPAPPERPLITYFTSRQVNLSWAHLQDSRNAPVLDFIIQIR